jgi:hypothetical protein
MAELKAGLEIPPIYSKKKLAKLSDVSYLKIYHASTGGYNSLDDNERARLYNVLFQEYERAAAALGFSVDGKRIKKA